MEEITMDSNPIKALKRITSKLVSDKKTNEVKAQNARESEELPTIQLSGNVFKRKTEEIKQYSSEEEARIRNRFANILASEENNTEETELLKPVEKQKENEPGEDYYIQPEDSETPLLTEPLIIPPIQMQNEFVRPTEEGVTVQQHIAASYIEEDTEIEDETEDHTIVLRHDSNNSHDEVEDDEEWMRRIEEEEERLERESTIIIKLETNE